MYDGVSCSTKGVLWKDRSLEGKLGDNERMASEKKMN